MISKSPGIMIAEITTGGIVLQFFISTTGGIVMQLILGCISKTAVLSCLYKGKKIVKYNNWICLSCSIQNVSKLENVSNLITSLFTFVSIYVEKNN